MLKKNQFYKCSRYSSQKGMASIEVIPFLVITFIMLGYGLGFFGVVHTAIVGSMSARAYAFETLRNRAHPWTLRDVSGAAGFQYYQLKNRLHGVSLNPAVSGGNSGGQGWSAFRREITFQGFPFAASQINAQEKDIHDKISGTDLLSQTKTADERREAARGYQANPVWIKIKYGLCLTPSCGD